MADQPAERATMRDVAALAGVSLKTVSRVVNGETTVAPELVEKVNRAASRLAYRHNLSASNLRRGSSRTGVIGALLQDVGNSFSASLLRSLEDTARTRRDVVLTASLDEEADREHILVADLVSRRVDGLVMMAASTDQTYLEADLRAGLRVVFVDREPHGVVADCVLVDNVRGAIAGTSHLVEHGHRRIAYLADLVTIETARQRQRGFERALRAAGTDPDPDLVVTGLRSSSAAQEATLGLFDGTHPPPTALFCGRNTVTIGAARALRELGLARSVALVGFDDFPLADLLDPALTVVRQDVTRLGHEAARQLYSRIEGDASPARRHVLRPTLVVRGSGEIRPPTPQH
ncbi:MAG: LacI family transcriptional regulator [Actinomycetota bacterium]|nr:LacI family transcriptional regulator [Actinomycetota bacterium]